MPDTYRILVVDDEALNRQLLSDMLALGRYDVESCAEGREALAKLDEKTFHLVITDLRMAGMGGLELLAEVRIRHPRLPVVVVTAHASLETTIEALRLGATNFLKKPFSRDEILGVAGKSLRPWHINAGKRAVIPSMKKTLSIDVQSRAEVIDPVFYHLYDDAVSLGFPEGLLRMNVYLALNEAIANAIDHGNAGDETKSIRIGAELTHEELRITVSDQGPGFDPDLVADPTLPENLLRTRGRGVFLMRCYMDRVEYHDRGATVVLVKRADGTGETPAAP